MKKGIITTITEFEEDFRKKSKGLDIYANSYDPQVGPQFCYSAWSPEDVALSPVEQRAAFTFVTIDRYNTFTRRGADNKVVQVKDIVIGLLGFNFSNVRDYDGNVRELCSIQVVSLGRNNKNEFRLCQDPDGVFGKILKQRNHEHPHEDMLLSGFTLDQQHNPSKLNIRDAGRGNVEFSINNTDHNKSLSSTSFQFFTDEYPITEQLKNDLEAFSKKNLEKQAPASTCASNKQTSANPAKTDTQTNPVR